MPFVYCTPGRSRGMGVWDVPCSHVSPPTTNITSMSIGSFIIWQIGFISRFLLDIDWTLTNQFVSIIILKKRTSSKAQAVLHKVHHGGWLPHSRPQSSSPSPPSPELPKCNYSKYKTLHAAPSNETGCIRRRKIKRKQWSCFQSHCVVVDPAQSPSAVWKRLPESWLCDTYNGK